MPKKKKKKKKKSKYEMLLLFKSQRTDFGNENAVFRLHFNAIWIGIRSM